ncbi:MAG: type II toxin-antitoxin system Phd/YefM family antitoxin [Chlamydiae bacterium]|nr:type II toxin-antitoxin system Phd/YefM family antitoxin [Chlamydiota bacterium]MBI3278087.1 type II toxin-antitoxin system Phd/YefM family antitoxin [Chlamydiota bacterium]
MTRVTTSEARQKLFQLVRRSIKGHVPIRITSKSGDVILMSEDDYESLLETLELLSIKGVLKGVQEAKEDIRMGRTKSLKEVFG